VKLYNAGKSAVERIDFICSSSLEHRKLLVMDQESIKIMVIIKIIIIMILSPSSKTPVLIPRAYL